MQNLNTLTIDHIMIKYQLFSETVWNLTKLHLSVSPLKNGNFWKYSLWSIKNFLFHVKVMFSSWGI